MAEIRCTGRPVDDRLRPTGDPCGRRLPATTWPGDLRQIAMAAGWSIAPDGTATCPACRRPPAEVAALVREVRRG